MGEHRCGKRVELVDKREWLQGGWKCRVDRVLLVSVVAEYDLFEI